MWSEHQAALLRRLVAAEKVADQIDWENVIEEVELSGTSSLRTGEISARPGAGLHAEGAGVAGISRGATLAKGVARLATRRC